ncbi:MAG: hypothetical protein A2297_04570 [Elusimicrobia bacterium RIFOXYB2_FULL_48_7]|nr:MAG: hypothetical protein A2297_04570 [Elusimicrobia bacterium RIFOXYB2_FULL_48_7]
MEKPVNILYIITDLNIGGTEKMLFETVTRLDKSRYNPTVVGLKKCGECASRLRDSGVEVHVMDIYRLGVLFSPFLIPAALFRIRRIAKDSGARIVHTYLFQANIAARLAFLAGRRPLIVSSIRVMEKQKTWHLFFERITSSLCDKLIVNSKTLKEFLVGKNIFPGNKVTVIYNGIDTSRIPKAEKNALCAKIGCSPDNILIGSIGRLHKQKGFEYLIKAAALLVSRGEAEHLQFLIVGDGPDRKKLEKMAEKPGLKNKIVFTGWNTNTLEIISALDIFILPSLWEGTPNVILEAMACGKPVISTATGAVTELIENNKEGILVQPSNPEELAEKIEWCVKNREKASAMGQKAREKAGKLFSMDKMISETDSFYRGLLHQ